MVDIERAGQSSADQPGSRRAGGVVGSTLQALEADRDALLALGHEMPDSVWAKPSGCRGWSVADVVSHMACSFWLAVDPSRLPDPGGLAAERAAELYVESRRSLTHQQLLADYESVSLRGLEILAAAEGQDVDIPLGDVGTYRASVVPTAFAFEHYIHIRCDLFPPGGPLKGEPPACDELRLAPTLDWIEAALPQQNADLLDGMDTAVEVHLTGVSGRMLRIGGANVAAHITSDSHAFVQWVTQRATWDALGVQAEGDRSALEIVRKLKVF